MPVAGDARFMEQPLPKEAWGESYEVVTQAEVEEAARGYERGDGPQLVQDISAAGRGGEWLAKHHSDRRTAFAHTSLGAVDGRTGRAGPYKPSILKFAWLDGGKAALDGLQRGEARLPLPTKRSTKVRPQAAGHHMKSWPPRASSSLHMSCANRPLPSPPSLPRAGRQRQLPLQRARD